MSRFRCVIVDRCQLFREAISYLLEPQGIAAIAVAASMSELAATLEGTDPPDVALWSIDPDMELAACDADFRHIEIAGLPTIVLSQEPNAVLLQWAAQTGLHAVLCKNISCDVLQRSIELVMLGQRLFPPLLPGPSIALEPTPSPAAPGAPGGLVDERVPLSEREQQILRHLVAGESNKLIARELGITEGTVKVHVKSLLRKLGAVNRTQAAIWGMDHGILVRGRAPSVVNGERSGAFML